MLCPKHGEPLLLVYPGQPVLQQEQREQRLLMILVTDDQTRTAGLGMRSYEHPKPLETRNLSQTRLK